MIFNYFFYLLKERYIWPNFHFYGYKRILINNSERKMAYVLIINTKNECVTGLKKESSIHIDKDNSTHPIN